MKYFYYLTVNLGKRDVPYPTAHADVHLLQNIVMLIIATQFTI